MKQNVGLLYIFYTNYVSENLALVRAKNSVLKSIRGAKRVEKNVVTNLCTTSLPPIPPNPSSYAPEDI